MSELSTAELNSAHDVKVLLCYLLEKLDMPVEEEQLYEIIVNSEIVNYFLYTEALDSLIKNNSVSREVRDGKNYIVLEEKGRSGADYFNETIPHYFRKKILKEALYYFARIRHENEAETDIVRTKNGFEVNCRIKDVEFDLMKLSLYAPDEDQAKLIREKILLDPVGFYRKMIEFVLENEEEKIDIPV